MPTKRARPKRVKPTGALAAIAETRKVETALLGDIQKYWLAKTQEATDRREDVLHPSEMAKADWCPRASVYRISGHEPSNPDNRFNFRRESIFEEGHWIHGKWQKWLADMGRLWGRWRCPACETTFYATSPRECTHCAYDGALDYREVPLDAEDTYLILGHADGAVPDVGALLEIKSIGEGTVRFEDNELLRRHTHKVDGKTVVDLAGLFRGIKRPFASHRRQASVYLAIARLLGLPYDRMVFIYENKANQDTKEFVLKYSEDLVAPLLEAALDVQWAVRNDRLLPRPFPKDSKTCKACPFLDLCWSENDETSEPQRDPGDGAVVAGGEEAAGAQADRPARTPRVRGTRTAGRPQRGIRQRTDEPVRAPDEVGGVPERAVGHRRGGRKVRRSRPREGEGH